MRHFEIYHASSAAFGETVLFGIRTPVERVRALWDSGAYQRVAAINAMDLDDAYRRTQNIDRPWRKPVCRSTSVGDIIKDGDTWSIVAMFGFEQLKHTRRM